MIVVVWEFHVRSATRAEFLRHYASDGTWAGLFSKSPEYLGTELLQDADSPDRFVCIDRWTSCAAFAAFLNEHRPEYDALDHTCTELTVRETRLGTFNDQVKTHFTKKISAAGCDENTR